MTKKDPIPVTVLTGFLGAGKTTLLNQLLSQKHGYKCAIIINEFGAISIDHQLVVGADEEILELNNGCLCCRVRGDLVRSLQDLFRKQKRFDYVLIETTGLADPTPIMHTFRATDLAERLRLDGVITVVDARHIEKELGDGPEPAAQVACADVLLLNKTDLVSAEDLARIERRLRKMNGLAVIHRTRDSRIDPARIFNLKAREVTGAFTMPEPPPTAVPVKGGAGCGHEDDPGHVHDEHCAHGTDHGHGHGPGHNRAGEHEDAHDHAHGEREEHEEHGHRHDESVATFYLVEERPLDLAKVEAWLTEIIRELGNNIYRSKGILYVQGQARRIVFQGVQTMFDARPDRLWNVGEKKMSQLVFIGKDLDKNKVCQGFADCLAS
jgi:G3E family GTPase